MTQIGSTYGTALYQLAQQEQLTADILQELHVLDTAFGQEPDFVKLLSSHNLSKQERCDIIERSFRGKVHEYILNFLKILTEKGYMRHFSACCAAYEAQYNADHGILPVQAVTAVPLTPEQLSRLTEKLAKLSGKEIQLTNRVDPRCLGGVRLDYDGKRLDGTVAHRLEDVRSLLKNTVL